MHYIKDRIYITLHYNQFNWGPPKSNGFTYLFTAIGPFSKFGIAVPIRNKEAVTVARVLVEHVILKYGLFFNYCLTCEESLKMR